MAEKEKQKIVRSNNSTIISLEKGKIPPQAIDLEEAVIGSCLIDKNAISEAAQILGTEDCFYKESNQIIYDTMISMFRDSEPIDLLTISTKLKSINKLDAIGGDYTLISLSEKVSSSAHLEYHCRIIMQMYVKRESIKVASQIIENAYNEDTDIFDLLANSQRDIDNVAQWLVRKKPLEFENIVNSIFEEPDIKAGLPSKLSIVQKETNGFSEPDVIIVAARPGMGKTAYMLNEAKHKAKQGIPVGIFSLEMSAKQLTERMLAEECGIDSKIIKQRKWNDFELRLMKEKRAEFEKLPIFIHDQAGLSPMEMKLQAGKWKRENAVRMCFIDYLQLMSASGKNSTGNREQEISYISRSIKSTAKELEIPIMALSQLSRAVETRGGMKRPLLSDLRESGAIEQDADIVIFLLRPEYYRIYEWDDDDRTSTVGQCELNFAKHRGGEVFSVVVKSNLKYMRFEDLEVEDTWEDIPPPLTTPQDAFEETVEDIIPEDEEEFPFLVMAWTKKDLDKLNLSNNWTKRDPKNNVLSNKYIINGKISNEKEAIKTVLWLLKRQGLIQEVIEELLFHEKRKFRFDWCIPEFKIAIEYEGIFSKKSRHTTIQGFSTDCDKYNLALINGWKVLRYTAINYKNLESDLKN